MEYKKEYLELLMNQHSDLRAEIRQILDQNHQTSMACLIYIGGTLTLVTTLTEKFPFALSIVMLLLPFTFLPLVFSFAGRMIALSNISSFLAYHVEPTLANEASKESMQNMTWERYLANHLNKFERWSEFILWIGGQLALMVLPVVISFTSFLYIIVNQNIPFQWWWSPIILALLLSTVIAFEAIRRAIVQLNRIKK